MMVQVSEGVTRESVALGKLLMVVRFTFRSGASVSPHHHMHEQSSYIVEGRLRYHIEGEEVVLGPGESLVMPANAEHYAVALEDTIDVNSFTPLREDYL